MGRLLDLPVELLDKVFDDLDDDKNMTLKSICLAGQIALTEVARRVSFRQLHVALKVPVPDDHVFYRRFRIILNDTNLRSRVRCISFQCSGPQESLKLTHTLTTGLPRFIQTKSVHLSCGHSSHRLCTTNITLPPVIRIPLLDELHITGVLGTPISISNEFFPTKATPVILRKLVLNAATLHYYTIDSFSSNIRGLETLEILNGDETAISIGVPTSSLFLLDNPFGLPVNRDNLRHLYIHLYPDRQPFDFCTCSLPALEELVLVAEAPDSEWVEDIFESVGAAFGKTLKRFSISVLREIDINPRLMVPHASTFSVLEELGFQVLELDDDSFIEEEERFHRVVSEMPVLEHLYVLPFPGDIPYDDDFEFSRGAWQFAERMGENAPLSLKISWVQYRKCVWVDGETGRMTMAEPLYREPEWLKLGSYHLPQAIDVNFEDTSSSSSKIAEFPQVL